MEHEYGHVDSARALLLAAVGGLDKFTHSLKLPDFNP